MNHICIRRPYIPVIYAPQLYLLVGGIHAYISTPPTMRSFEYAQIYKYVYASIFELPKEASPYVYNYTNTKSNKF